MAGKTAENVTPHNTTQTTAPDVDTLYVRYGGEATRVCLVPVQGSLVLQV